MRSKQGKNKYMLTSSLGDIGIYRGNSKEEAIEEALKQFDKIVAQGGAPFGIKNRENLLSSILAEKIN